MNLKYELPPGEKELAERYLQGKSIQYCTPFDLDRDGQFSRGWLVITRTRILLMARGSVVRQMAITDGKEYRAVTGVGSGHLETQVAGQPVILLRYSMSHAARYKYIASILNQLREGKIPRVKVSGREDHCPRCGRVYPGGSRVCPHCLDKAAVLRRLAGIVRPYWPMLLLAAVLFWGIAGLRLLIPWIYRGLIDGYLVVQKRELGGILLYVGGIGAANLLMALLTITRNRLMVRAGSLLARDLRAMVYAKIQALSISYLDGRKPGDLMNRVTGDTRRVQRFVQHQATMFLNEIISLVAVCAILFASNWKLALLVLIPTPVVTGAAYLFRRQVRIRFHRQWRVWDRANSLLQDILSGIRVVKAFGQEKKEVARFKGISKKLADITASNEKLWNTVFPSLGFLMGLGNFLVLYYGGGLVLGERLQLGELVQFSQYAAILYGPLNWLSFFPRWFARAVTAAERVFELIDEEPDVKDRPQARPHKIQGRVTLKNVTFGYHKHEPVLKNINLDVASGEMIGLVGHSGAGKSTLINLVMRLYDVDEGQILIDGIDIRDIRQANLRGQIGVVLQETFLFSGTILDNIRYSKPDASRDEVIRAAKIANAHDFIMNFPDGYDTRVGERGQRLSGGERQRIAIARAVLHDPRILILDEATSSVDTETEQQIQEALARLVKNRTTFAIAHRLSTLRNADRLLVIENGEQVELGTHAELLKAKGIYYRLVMAQRRMSRIQGVGG